MAIDDLKRWHWVVIGAVLGALIALAQVLGGNEPSANLPSVGRLEFEEDLRAKPRDGSPVMENITVHPGPRGEPDLVTFDRRTDWGRFGTRNDGTARQIRYLPHRIYLPRPFKPMMPAPGAKAGNDYTVRDYLRDLARTEPAGQVAYRYAWWKEPKTAFALWTAGGVLIIGGVWPTVLQFLVGAGFGRRAPKDPDYDLNRFHAGPDQAKQDAAVVDPHAVEDHVRQLEEELARNLSATAAGGFAPDGAAKQPVKPLVSAPVEAPAPQGDERKEYQGEFYPVVKPHHDEPHA